LAKEEQFHRGIELDDGALTPGDKSTHRPDPLRGLAQPGDGRANDLATQRRVS